MLPIYQGATEWPDEWFADNNWTAAETLQIMKDMIASSEAGNYSAFVNNIHPIRYTRRRPDHPRLGECPLGLLPCQRHPDVVGGDAARTSPMARAAASFDDLAWNGSDLSFTFATPTAGQH